MNACYIFWTTSNLSEAKLIANELLNKKLVACVNIIPEIHSLYTWKGKVEEEREVKVIFKTLKKHFSEIEKVILEKGSYEVPEISCLEITSGHAPYLQWLHEQVSEV